MGVNHVTLSHATKPGYWSIQQFNSSKQLLPPAIEDILVKFLLGLADMGIGMDPKMLTEKANEIIQETIDPKHEGVDHNFTTYFFAWHEKQLQWLKILVSAVSIKVILMYLLQTIYKAYMSRVGYSPYIYYFRYLL